jgi:hypothetical protein
MPVPRRAAVRRDERACGALASSPTATYCRRHERLAAEDQGNEDQADETHPKPSLSVLPQELKHRGKPVGVSARSPS